MKGYYTSTSYMGWIPQFGKYIEFANEKEYKEFYRERNNYEYSDNQSSYDRSKNRFAP